MLTCSEALKQYYYEHAVERVVARRRLEYAIDALNGFMADKPLQDVDIPLCRAYRGHRGVSDSTVRRELGVLQAASNHARKWKRITLDKMPSIELPPESEPRLIWLYKDELAQLLEIAQEKERVLRFIQIAYHTAGRKASIETLEWSQVDLDAKRINLSKAGERQTKKRRPIVPVSEAMCGILQQMKDKADNQWVLGSPNNIAPGLEYMLKKAGMFELPERGLRAKGNLTAHVLRHSRATHLLQDGRTPYAVAQLLGDTIVTLLKTYGHACPDYMAEIMGES